MNTALPALELKTTESRTIGSLLTKIVLVMLGGFRVHAVWDKQGGLNIITLCQS